MLNNRMMKYGGSWKEKKGENCSADLRQRGKFQMLIREKMGTRRGIIVFISITKGTEEEIQIVCVLFSLLK